MRISQRWYSGFWLNENMAAAACADRQTALCRSQVFPALIGRVGVLFVIYAVVILCDPIWHVSSRSGEASCELLYSVYLYLTFTDDVVSSCWQHWRADFVCCRRPKRNFKNTLLLLTAIWSIVENKLNVKSRPTALKPKNANVTHCGDCFAATWLECIGLAHAESTVQWQEALLLQTDRATRCVSRNVGITSIKNPQQIEAMELEGYGWPTWSK